MCVKLTVALARRFGSEHLARLSPPFPPRPRPLLHPLSRFFLFSLYRSLFMCCRVVHSLARSSAREAFSSRSTRRNVRLNGMAQKYTRARARAKCLCLWRRAKRKRVGGRGLRRADRLQADTRKRMPVRSLSISTRTGCFGKLLPNFDDTRYSSDEAKAVSIERDRFFSHAPLAKENAINVRDILRI